MLRIMLCFVCLLSATAATSQVTHHVPADFSTIQDAIAAAFDGDTVLVSPGTYSENLDFLGKSITVESLSGPDVTTLQGDAAKSIVVFANGEGNDSILRGFTIQNGGGPSGAVYVRYSSPRIVGNRITGNHGCAGTGVYSYRGSPIIQGNEITDNVGPCSGGGGGGILIIGPFASAQILDNLIARNVITSGSGGGIYLNYAGETLIRNNIITGNSATAVYIPASQGGGIYSHDDSNPTLVQNLIYGNTADEGGGIYSREMGYLQRGVRAFNNTVAGNVARNGRGSAIGLIDASGASDYVNNILVGENGASVVWCDPASSSYPDYRYNDVYTTGGTLFQGACSNPIGQNGNISADPSFTEPANADYRLEFGSPAIDSGDSDDPELPTADLEGRPRMLDGDHDGVAVVDMGAFEKLNAIYASKDSFLNKGSKNTNEGANPKLAVDAWRTMLEFPIAGLTTDFVQEVKLRLTLAGPATNWGTAGRNVAVRALLAAFDEGNGKKFEVPTGQKTSGSGAGVTWNCSSDADISDTNADCGTLWAGGDPALGGVTDVALHTAQMTGPVEWDVTSAVVDALSSGETVVRFVVMREFESQAGHAEYHSREGAAAMQDSNLAPQLLVNP